jgi:lysyl endopeptidase
MTPHAVGLLDNHNRAPLDPNALRGETVMRIVLSHAAIVVSWLLVSTNAAGVVVSMPDRDAIPGSRSNSIATASLSTLPVLATIRLTPPSTAEVIRAKAVGRTNAIGFGRAPGTEDGAITVQVPAGQASARISVTSPSATSLRTGLLLSVDFNYAVAAWTAGETLAVLAEIARDRDPMEPAWSALTRGDTQELVVTRLLDDGKAWTFSLLRVSHIDTDVLWSGSDFGEKLGLGDAASCQIDLACVLTVLSPTQQNGLLESSRAVALLVLTFVDGNTAYCTGTLLNSASYPTALILTANHCISEGHLSGLTMFWFFSRPDCASGLPTNTVQQVVSGKVLWKSASLDGALLLNDQIPPSPASYSGWDASRPAPGVSVLAIHHPKADVKKASLGTLLGANSNPITVPDLGTFPPGTFFEVDWRNGITEPGSSGSGMFADSGDGLTLRLRGTLTAGTSSCSINPRRTWYSQLFNMYPAIAQFLNAPISGINIDQHGLTGSWYQPTTDGQGIELEIYKDLNGVGTGFMQGSWFTFDATASGGADHNRWYTFSGSVSKATTGVSLPLYQNVGGNFNAPPVTSATQVGNVTLTFINCTTAQFRYVFTDGSNQSGTMSLIRLMQNVSCAAADSSPGPSDFGLSGNWYDPTRGGQGLVFELNPVSRVLFFAWYTYAVGGRFQGAAGQRWYTAQAAYTPGMRTIPVLLYETAGGRLNSPTPVTASAEVGNATLVFSSCAAAKLTYVFTGGSNAGESGIIDLVRVGPTPSSCTFD